MNAFVTELSVSVINQKLQRCWTFSHRTRVFLKTTRTCNH